MIIDGDIPEIDEDGLVDTGSFYAGEEDDPPGSEDAGSQDGSPEERILPAILRDDQPADGAGQP